MRGRVRFKCFCMHVRGFLVKSLSIVGIFGRARWLSKQAFVHMHVGLKRFYDFEIDSCAQARLS